MTYPAQREADHDKWLLENGIVPGQECERCAGFKKMYRRIPGTEPPKLESKPCDVCNGTGRAVRH